MKRVVKYTLVLLLVVLSFFAGHYKANRNEPILQLIEKVDTLFVRDTIVQTKPIYVDRIKTERVPVVVRDTIRQNDTLYVYLDREQLHWRDSLSSVYVSGINPQVDSVIHYINEKVVTRVEVREVYKSARWGVGVNLGYGISRDGLSPYVGVGINYNFIRF